ncbi:hypothetical protein BX616_010403 [Lobosporangium transversale]|nr:hypothetical protein BX616_010403 [Lobosporangium transversale]
MTTLITPNNSINLHPPHDYHDNHYRKTDVTQSDSSKDSAFGSEETVSGPVQIAVLTPDEQNSNRCSEKGSLPDGEAQDHSKELGRICTWADLPQWMRDNPAILTGYRRATYSYQKCVRSLWYLHNETVNIWSHLLGAVAFVIIAPLAYFKVLEIVDTVRWTDIVVQYAFLAGAIVCLSLSASFHTFCCHSEKVFSQWVRCDYLGIIFLIVGSYYPALYYGFYCQSTLQILYISIISILGGATIIVVMQPRFQTPQYRWVRSALFLAVGLSGLCPIIHGIILYGFVLAQKAVALNYIFCMGAAYVVGALIYGSRTPERFFPGKFDNFMASHQIFHV